MARTEGGSGNTINYFGPAPGPMGKNLGRRDKAGKPGRNSGRGDPSGLPNFLGPPTQGPGRSDRGGKAGTAKMTASGK